MRAGAVVRWAAATVTALGCPSTPPPSVRPEPAVSPPPPAKAPAPAPTGATVTEVGPFVAAVHGMAVLADESLLFADSYAQLSKPAAVYRLAPPYSGTPQATDLEATTPAGITAVGSEVLLCDVGAGTVRRLDADLVVLQTWAVSAPWNAEVLPSGELAVVTFGNELLRLGDDGSVEQGLANLMAPFDLQPASDETLWVSEQGNGADAPGRLARWDLNTEARQDVDYTWANPEGMALDGSGDLWVAETERHELVRVSPAGEVVEVHAVDGLPIVMAPLASGALLVSVTGPRPHLLRVTP
ncbi:MAG: hypothetical protein AAF721_13235 [Myxococcota bacterium]